ncbi:PACE efflux transporter [Viridibacterium curvum]|uniref:PACE efflux transporter n=1 Tax=Viridibacterium curvum TaxID=1101404 RepID=A0ABP9QS11_9RHOO
MQGLRRKITHAILFEFFAIVCVTITVMFTTDHGAASSGGLAVVTSAIAVLWNMAYNWAFERWEARQTKRGRSLRRRAVHAIGFELGLVVLLLPVMTWWLNIGVLAALGLEFGLLLFFVVYGFVFNWCFDHIFGLPAAARH